MKFKNHYNSHEFPVDHEINSLPSLTVPDQSMSMQTILERYARGLPLDDRQRVPFYDGDEYVPDLKRLDLAQIEDLRNDAAESVKTLKQQAKDEKAAAKKAKEAQEKAAADAAAALSASSSQSAGDSNNGSKKA